MSRLDVQYTDTELCDDIRRVASIVGHVPSLTEYREHGDHSVTTYYDRFGSWNAALETAGFSSRGQQEAIETADLIAALTELADETDGPPTATDMNETGPYWASTYRRHFGSWANALAAAGFEVDASRRRASPTDAELIAELRRLATEIGSAPTTREMDAQGKYGSRTYTRRFDSWDAALTVADLDADPDSTRISTADLLADLQRLESELDHRPTSRDVAEHGTYGVATYQRRFGSWSAAVTAAFDDATDDVDPADSDS